MYIPEFHRLLLRFLMDNTVTDTRCTILSFSDGDGSITGERRGCRWRGGVVAGGVVTNIGEGIW